MIRLDKEEVVLEDLNEELEVDDSVVESVTDTEEVLDGKEGETIDKVKEEYQNKLVRLQADFDNFRKRTVKEKEDIYKYAISSFAEKLLPIMDNMERALKAIEDANIEDSYVDGVKMVSNTLKEVLKSEGVEEVETNTQFDPQCHHGVAVESIDEIEDNQIIEVYQKGYKYKDKVIRPAMVKICKK